MADLGPEYGRNELKIYDIDLDGSKELKESKKKIFIDLWYVRISTSCSYSCVANKGAPAY